MQSIEEMKHMCYEKMAPLLLKKLIKRNFDAYYCPTKEEAAQLVLEMIPQNHTVAFGGSITLEATGVIPLLYKQENQIINRDLAKDINERHALMKQSLLADTYLTSVNGITEDGILVNIDSVGNRVAAITYGPDQVIAIVGMNKIYKDVSETVNIIRNKTAPLNAQRLKLSNTPCAKGGFCGDCLTDDCICSTISIMRRCKLPNRIKIILVGETLGL